MRIISKEGRCDAYNVLRTIGLAGGGGRDGRAGDGDVHSHWPSSKRPFLRGVAGPWVGDPRGLDGVLNMAAMLSCQGSNKILRSSLSVISNRSWTVSP